MQLAAANLEYEKAAEIRDMIEKSETKKKKGRANV